MEATQLAHFNELDAGVIFGFDLIGFALQGKLQCGHSIKSAVGGKRQAICRHRRQGLQDGQQLVIGFLILFVLDPGYGHLILSLAGFPGLLPWS